MDTIIQKALDLQQSLLAVLRSIIVDISRGQMADRRSSKRAKAIARWHIYLGVMLAKGGEGVASLVASRNARAMIIVARSMFEYQQKAEYFLEHRKEAFEQYASIGARKFTELSRLAHPDTGVTINLAAEYLDWKRTAGARSEHSGDVKLLRMHLTNARAEDILGDKNGGKYTTEFQTAYGVPSLYAHGDALLMPEVFSNLADDSAWGFSENDTYFDCLSVLNAANAYLVKFCVKTIKAFDLGEERLGEVRRQFRDVFNATAELHKSNRRLV